jgi:SNF2 family DNA or RNA helicase
MIELDNIGSSKAITLLKAYTGKNPFLKKLCREHLLGRVQKLTPNEEKYIIKNHNIEPILVNKVLRVSDYLGEELKKQYHLPFVPEKLLVEFMLAEMDKVYHVYGKLTRKQEKSQMYWLPKTQVLDDPYFEEVNIDVDFQKYQEMDTFVLKGGTIGRTLYEHQKEGVKFLLARNGCILADDMGLGKTVISIVAALESGAEKILVVCPPSLKINWEREINYFCSKTNIIYGRKWKTNKFTIINYNILKNFHTVLDRRKKIDPEDVILRKIVDSKFDLMILDEAHKVKNYDSGMGGIMKDLAKNFNPKRMWLLTGTPMANRPMDYFNLLSIINSPIADNWEFYARRYCDAKQGWRTLPGGRKGKFLITTGNSNLEELAIKTKNLLLRRKKVDVLDMPDKTIIPIYNELTKDGRADYEGLWEEYLQERKKRGKRGDVDRDLVELILLRKFIAMEAIDNTVDVAISAIEQGQKVIIFTNFTDELNEIQSRLKAHKSFKAEKYKCVTHNGKMNNNEKQKSVDSFQDSSKTVAFIGNIISAGVGITMIAATHIIHLSRWWNPAVEEQCNDRIYRIGQENDCTIHTT